MANSADILPVTDISAFVAPPYINLDTVDLMALALECTQEDGGDNPSRLSGDPGFFSSGIGDIYAEYNRHINEELRSKPNVGTVRLPVPGRLKTGTQTLSGPKYSRIYLMP